MASFFKCFDYSPHITIKKGGVFIMEVKPSVTKKLTQYEIEKAEVQLAYTYMDYHLTLIHAAIEKDDKKELEFQIVQLKSIRDRLYELKYFRDK